MLAETWNKSDGSKQKHQDQNAKPPLKIRIQVEDDAENRFTKWSSTGHQKQTNQSPVPERTKSLSRTESSKGRGNSEMVPGLYQSSFQGGKSSSNPRTSIYVAIILFSYLMSADILLELILIQSVKVTAEASARPALLRHVAVAGLQTYLWIASLLFLKCSSHCFIHPVCIRHTVISSSAQSMEKLKMCSNPPR